MLSVVIEEHLELGGLASRVAMCVAKSPNCKMLLPFCTPYHDTNTVTHRGAFLKRSGMSPKAVAKSIIDALETI
jgi:transketolase C-terminal domain/subunit